MIRAMAVAVPVLVLQQRFLNWVSVSPEIAPRKARHKAAQRVGRSPWRGAKGPFLANRHGFMVCDPAMPGVLLQHPVDLTPRRPLRHLPYGPSAQGRCRMQVNNKQHCGWGGGARRPAEVPGVPEVAAGEGAGGGCITFQRVGGRGCCRGARRPIGSFGVPEVAAGEGAGGGCITFQRVGGRGCCRGARRPIGSFGVPEVAAGEGAGGGCITFQRVGGRGCCRGARRPIGSFGVPDLALGEGAGGGCITFQRVGGRGCCRGARRPIGSLGVPDVALGEGAGGGYRAVLDPGMMPVIWPGLCLWRSTRSRS